MKWFLVACDDVQYRPLLPIFVVTTKTTGILKCRWFIMVVHYPNWNEGGYYRV